MRRPSKQKCVAQACWVLRRRVRYRDAGLCLLGNDDPGKPDTEAIQEATWLYVETWIVPILDAIQREDYDGLWNLVRGEPGQNPGERWDV